MKKLDIIIPKCDYLGLPFRYTVNGVDAKLSETDLIYFSVKEKITDEEYIIQKSLNNGITYDEDNGKYLIEFHYKDTVNLKMNNNYLYDLVIYYEGTKPVQKLFGTFKIGPKVTLNEVV